jgi:hypothetical protein
MVEPQHKGQSASQPKPAMPEGVYRTDGTRLFRLINYELFAVRPPPGLCFRVNSDNAPVKGVLSSMPQRCTTIDCQGV